jgi:hypothetical protein
METKLWPEPEAYIITFFRNVTNERLLVVFSANTLLSVAICSPFFFIVMSKKSKQKKLKDA